MKGSFQEYLLTAYEIIFQLFKFIWLMFFMVVFLKDLERNFLKDYHQWFMQGHEQWFMQDYHNGLCIIRTDNFHTTNMVY